jgi:hypothetical protein
MQRQHSEKPRLLLAATTWWASSAVIALTLKQAGFAVTVLCPKGHPAWAEPSLGCVELSARNPLQLISEAIRSIEPDALVPLDDGAVAYLHVIHKAGPDRARRLVERSLGRPSSYSITLSRQRFLAAARDVGFRTPSGCEIADWRDLEAQLQARHEPVALKLDGTAGGQGVRIVRTVEDARRAYRQLRLRQGVLFAAKRWLINDDPFWLAARRLGRSSTMSAQAFVSGQQGNIALFALDGQLRGIQIADVDACAYEFGPSTFLRIVSRPDLADKTARLVAKLGLSGFFGVDFIIDDVSGEPMVIELNPRITALSGIQPHVPDSPMAAAAEALEATSERPEVTDEPRLHALFPVAWRAHPGDPRLEQCRQDVPDAHPDFIAETLRATWNNRRPLARMLSAVRPGSRRRAVPAATWQSFRLAPQASGDP